ncbi:MAG: vitamin B12-dependent ribonucleotide reductase, partial [Candidatus Nanoarchaeia archaeon]
MADNVLETKRGLEVPRLFTEEDQDVLGSLDYKKVSTKIVERDGTVVFEMNDVEVPQDWSQLASDILASKYIRKAGLKHPPFHEQSAKQVVHRIAHTIRTLGEEYGCFAEEEDAEAFEAELTYMLITQRGAFNSPVWFNCGLYHDYGIETGGGLFRYDPDLKKSVEQPSAYIHPQC